MVTCFNTMQYLENPNKFLSEAIRVMKPNGQLIINTLNKKQDASKIVYPYKDGKYQLKTLEDDDGKFFIIHPNEDYFIFKPEFDDKIDDYISIIKNYKNYLFMLF